MTKPPEHQPFYVTSRAAGGQVCLTCTGHAKAPVAQCWYDPRITSR